MIPTIYKSPQGREKIQRAYDQMLALWPHQPEQIYVDTSEGKTFVLTSGPVDAPPLVLLHGTLSNSATWMGDVQLWAKGYRVYAIDIIGEPGKSAETRPNMNSQMYSSWLAQVFEVLKLDRPIIVGLSLGGWMALDFATTYPDHIAGLVLLSPGGIGPNRNILSWALPYFFLGKWGIGRVYRKILGPLASQLNFDSEVGELLLDMVSQVKPRTEPLRVFSDQELRRVKSPVLLVLGGQDVTLFPVAIKERVVKLAMPWSLKLVAEAGHFLGDQSQPILEFLNSTLTTSANPAPSPLG